MPVLRTIIALALLFCAASARACSCGGEPTVEESLRSYRSVFVGTVTDIERKTWPVLMFGKMIAGRISEWFGGQGYDPTGPDYGLIVSLKVTEAFKSASVGGEIEVGTGFGGGDCGYPFEVGEQYLVYAWQSNEEGLTVGICSRTGKVEDRSADIRILRYGT